ncbi:hypothetical protein DICVIV_11833 [Dictyocaulus viviparus]|uniref:Protein kinase domain-containing protein n=1 Tax=Dictyocaulus viviparus TaxID=29172 RepID=A0A0D8XC67_DICVI|nr:hypothetical protein DICVIV_11833 [Dictyocaulus viviparus]
MLRTWCGSPPYAAPELLLGKEYDGLKADIWSLGVILYILVTGGFPFPGDNVENLKRAVLSCHMKIPYWVSVECADLIKKMLVIHPFKRLSINAVMQHRFVVKSSPLYRRPLKLNPTVLLFMQQHGLWTEEQIVDDVLKHNFESSIFATYEMLCDKIEKNSLKGLTNDYPRRGSRGSILSGKANVEADSLKATVSTHHLAQLNFSTSIECDSDDSSASDIYEESPSSSNNGKKQERCQFGLAMKEELGNRGEIRRHTLCASEKILSPDMMAQLPVSSPLYQAVLNHSAFTDLNTSPGGTNLVTSQLPLFFALPLMPMLDYAQMLPVPNSERRASAGENLLNPGTIESVNHIIHSAPTGNVARSIEEEGEGYLSKHAGKRNTVHTASSAFGPSSPAPRHCPYTKASSTERRSSWASPTITMQQQQQLERMHRQASNSEVLESSTVAFSDMKSIL